MQGMGHCRDRALRGQGTAGDGCREAEGWLRGDWAPRRGGSPPCCAKAAPPSGSGCSAGPPAAGTGSAAPGAPGSVLQGPKGAKGLSAGSASPTAPEHAVLPRRTPAPRRALPSPARREPPGPAGRALGSCEHEFFTHTSIYSSARCYLCCSCGDREPQAPPHPIPAGARDARSRRGVVSLGETEARNKDLPSLPTPPSSTFYMLLVSFKNCLDPLPLGPGVVLLLFLLLLLIFLGG